MALACARNAAAGRQRLSLGFALLLLCAPVLARAQGVNILTHHVDTARLGWNDRETQLTLANVNARQFGKLWETVLDGQVYGSPLYVCRLTLKGKTRDVVYAATQNNSVYALDADTGQILWGPKTLAPSLDADQYNGCTNINPRHGITSTPVIDLGKRTIYVCGITQPGIQQEYRVWALDILTGKVKPGWPVTLQGRYKGCVFDAGQLTQRGAINLVNGWLYMTFGSRCDIGEWHGWVMGVNANNPSAPQRAFTPAPTVEGGGMWGAAGVSADADGMIYAVTGNGDFTLSQDGDNVCESIIRLKPEGSELKFSKTPKDYYVPTTYKELDATDMDLGGSSCIVPPDQPGTSTPRLIVTCGKDGLVYMVNRDHLGGPGGELYKQRLFGNPATRSFGIMMTSPAYFDSGTDRFVYVSGGGVGPNGEKGIVALRIVPDGPNGKAKLETVWTQKRDMLGLPGAPFVSSNGKQDAIVWLIDPRKDGADLGPPGVLYAFNAVTGEPLYASDEEPTRDELTDARKFSCPTVANGRVYVGTRGVVCYGLLNRKTGGGRR